MRKEGAKLVIPSADISNAAALSSAVKSEAPAKTGPKAAVGSYTVQKGDTLYGIARKYGIKLTELLAMNNLDNSATLKVGQKIAVPQKASESAAFLEEEPCHAEDKEQISGVGDHDSPRIMGHGQGCSLSVAVKAGLIETVAPVSVDVVH